MDEITLHVIGGWVGMILVAGAYCANTRSWIKNTGRTYLFMNLAGAILMGNDLWHADKIFSGPFALQVFWVGVALWSLLRPNTK